MSERNLIAVMGPAGSGKTTFINLVSGANLRIGPGMEVGTNEIDRAYFELGGQPVTLIDTPGFDDTDQTQTDVLRELAAFLNKSYESGKKLAGVIYIHRISDVRTDGIASDNLRLFRNICGSNSMRNVVVVANMWGDITKGAAAEQERELKKNPKFFKGAIRLGAQIIRGDNTLDSARAIVWSLVGNQPGLLLYQDNLSKRCKALEETSAGMNLRSDQEETRHRKQMELLRDQFQLIAARRDEAHADELATMRREQKETLSIVEEVHKAKIAALEEEWEELDEEESVRGDQRGTWLRYRHTGRRIRLPLQETQRNTREVQLKQNMLDQLAYKYREDMQQLREAMQQMRQETQDFEATVKNIVTGRDPAFTERNRHPGARTQARDELRPRQMNPRRARR